MRRVALYGLLAASVSLGASRARYGGALQVALAGRPAEAEPVHADTLAEATLVGLTTRSLCAAPFTLSRPSPSVVHVDVPPTVKAQDVAAALRRAQAEPSPYRALLAPVSQVTSSAGGVDLTLAYAWPDLERALCHPALAIPGYGAFRLGNGPGRFTADTAFAAGRPFLDEVVVTSTDERGAERLFSQRRAHLALGLQPKDAAAQPMPYATGLLYSAALPDTFRAAFESSVDRGDLARLWARQPAAPLPPGTKVTRPSALNPPRDVTLAFDASLDDQRAVAARIQVRLHELGYRVALKAMPRRELRARWAKGDYELMLWSVLLPNRPASALAVLLESARAPELQQKHLPALGAIADDAARDEKARELLTSLALSVRGIPLYVQGLALQTGPTVQNLKLDAYGLPRLDDVFLGAE